MEPFKKEENTGTTLIAIASGKGGVGKSVIAAAMGAGFAMLNRKTVVIDADFGGSNLHQIVGILKPAYTYRDFQEGRYKTLDQIVVEHPRFGNLGLIFGAAGSYGMADETQAKKSRFLNAIRDIHAEYVVIDMGAGSAFHMLDIFSSADLGLVILNPDPLSLSEGFHFIKQVVIRNLSHLLRKYAGIKQTLKEFGKAETFRSSMRVEDLIRHIEEKNPAISEEMKSCIDHLQIALILNRVTQDEQAVEVKAFQKALEEIFSIRTELLGIVHDDPNVGAALNQGVPFISLNPKSPASRDLADLIITRLLHRNRFQALFDRSSVKKRSNESQLNAGTRLICSVNCMYWDECGYKKGGYPCKLQHMGEVGFQGNQ